MNGEAPSPNSAHSARRFIAGTVKRVVGFDSQCPLSPGQAVRQGRSRLRTGYLSFVQTGQNDLDEISFWCQPELPMRSFDENNNISSGRAGRRERVGLS